MKPQNQQLRESHLSFTEGGTPEDTVPSPYPATCQGFLTLRPEGKRWRSGSQEPIQTTSLCFFSYQLMWYGPGQQGFHL
jgi:hypothetical protein